KAPSPSPSPAGGEGKNIAPPLRGGDKGEGDLCGFTNELLSKKWSDIGKIIKKSGVRNEIKQKGINIFKRLFEAEAKVHGEPFNTVHLHELGAVDCIVDIFGTVIGLDMLGIQEIYASSVNIGGGSIKSEHGILPVPAPATAEILRSQESRVKSQESEVETRIYSDGTQFELTTPTGAAILRELSSGFGAMPSINVEKIGIGAGTKDFKDRPNVLRMFIGESSATIHPPIPPLVRGGDGGVVTVIETNIDDMNPQIYEYVMERLFKAGALDVYLTQVIMKKGRPGIKLTVLCNNKEKDKLADIILKETTTIGLRFYEANRQILKREIRQFDTELGRIKFKISKLGSELIKVTPEYEDCRRLAKKLNMPLIDVLKKVSSRRLIY
ncbi:MAG: nickel pincer cofactor biosynthesis protein LarC, partial [Nitrospirae bacterium]|nr:nickel pincer cofactor biosynthesis protein LarC [Nitrospirota bacterium]